MSLTMTSEEREQFLAGVHVGVLSVASEHGVGTLAVPVGYSYQPGGPVWNEILTGGSTFRSISVSASFPWVGTGRSDIGHGARRNPAPPGTIVCATSHTQRSERRHRRGHVPPGRRMTARAWRVTLMG
jgi:hypothetical protein